MNNKKKLLGLLAGIFISFITSPAIAQYSSSDSLLIRTTFLREFDKNIINEYLTSNNTEKTNAALLSISHSEDTTFIDSIIALAPNDNSVYKAFALAQLGESKKATNYLLQNLTNSFNENYLLALGKCGDSLTLAAMLDSNSNSVVDINSPLNSALFPMVIVDFHARGITNTGAQKYLLENLERKSTSGRENYDSSFSSRLGNSILDDVRLLNTVYALFRLGSAKDAIPTLTEILSDDIFYQTKLYALGNFRKLEYFPNSKELLKKLTNSDSWLIRTETANSACFFPFKNEEEIRLYLDLVEDKNPNVSRSAAKGIRKLKIIQQEYLKKEIKKIITEREVPDNTKGELFISYALLFNVNSEKMIDEFFDVVEAKFIYRLLRNEKSDWNFNYNFLKDRIQESSEVELLDLLPAYLALQNKLFNDTEYASYLLRILEGNKPSSVSIIAEELKLPFIMKHKDALQELLLKQIFKNMNNPQFAETIVALTNLAFKLDRPFYDSVIEMLAKSELYSLKKYALVKIGSEVKFKKDTHLFDMLWKDAFKYYYAEVITNRGSFTLKFHPEYSPMTCANFIRLAKEKFYNGVKFHRVVPDFVIQTGDTSGTGWGGPGYEIVSEFSPIPFNRGAVGIASIGKDTEGSQWFVMHSNFPHLNGRYSNWAEVSEGMDVVDIIDEGDIIISVKLK